MDIKEELEKIEELSNGQIKVNRSLITSTETTADTLIRVKDKNGNEKSVNMGLSNKENDSKIEVSSKNPNDFGEPRKFESDCEGSSLLDTLQKKIIPEIEKALK